MIRRMARTAALFTLTMLEEILSRNLPTNEDFEEQVRANSERKIAEEDSLDSEKPEQVAAPSAKKVVVEPAIAPSVKPAPDLKPELSPEEKLKKKVMTLRMECAKHFDSKGQCNNLIEAFRMHDLFEELKQDKVFWDAIIKDGKIRLFRFTVRDIVEKVLSDAEFRTSKTAANMSNKLYADREQYEDESFEQYQNWRIRHLKCSMERRATWALDVVDEHIVHSGNIQHQLAFVRNAKCMHLLAQAERNLLPQQWAQFAIPFDRNKNADYQSVILEEIAQEAYVSIDRRFHNTKGLNRRDRAYQAQRLYHTLVLKHEKNRDGALERVFLATKERKDLMITIERAISKANKPKEKKPMTEKQRTAKKAKATQAAAEQRKRKALKRIENVRKLYLKREQEKAHRVFQQALNDFPDEIKISWEELTEPLKQQLKPKQEESSGKGKGRKGKGKQVA